MHILCRIFGAVQIVDLHCTRFSRSPTKKPGAKSGCGLITSKTQEAVSIRTDRRRKALRYGGAKRHQLMPATTAHAGVVVDTYSFGPG